MCRKLLFSVSAVLLAAMSGNVLAAVNPSPSDGATDVPVDVSLSWWPLVIVHGYDVYFGTDFEEVHNANPTTPDIYKGRQTEKTYNPGTLEFGQTYYWRIDEVIMPIMVHKGEVWSFTTMLVPTTISLSWCPYSSIAKLGPNDFNAPVPDIKERTDPCDPNIIYVAQVWTYVRVARTVGGTFYAPGTHPKDPNNLNWVFEPNIPPRIEAGFDPNKSWNSAPNDANVLDHEQGHLDLAEIAAREAQAEIDSGIKDGTLKGEGKTRADAIKDAKGKIHKIINKHIGEHQEKYDKDTRGGIDKEAQKKAREEQKKKLKQANKDPTQKKGPDAKSKSDKSCTYHPDFGLAFTDNLIEMVPDPLDPVIGAELIMPVFYLVGQTTDSEFFFRAEAGASTVEIQKDDQTYLSVWMLYMLYSPTENMFYGLGMGFLSNIPEGISAYVDGVCQALTSKNTLTLYGVEIYPDGDFMVLTNGFTTPGDCTALGTTGMRIVGSGLEADLNEDYRVDFKDFAILGDQWFQAPGYPTADISPLGGDGIVNFEDLALLAAQWLEGAI